MSFAASSSRLVLRRSAPARLTVPRVRFESTNTASKATESAKGAAETAKSAAGSAKATTETAAQKAADIQKQAAAGLAKATEYSKQAAAGLAKAGASAQAMTKQLSKQGGAAGRVATLVDKQIPFVVYWSRVVMETAKLIFQAQKMSPPPISAFQAYVDAVMSRLKNPGDLMKSTQQIVVSARNLSSAQIVSGSVIAAECLGFFTVGEMIGRFKIIGYRGKTESHH
ncbi:hypothetical protein MKZ38_006286 [Zalerion maritima]|uniref:Uncharacterized protein n=1 Tax=Zalerion maritima TaxID=339359 RepID=A0AAD5RJ23_9PEZI|nr:hypothetical protein MKZ38_006286 [Zalerion maritima]